MRPKRIHKRRQSFNTQPPEGGWKLGWSDTPTAKVSTHSRPKAAGSPKSESVYHNEVSTHSRPKAAGKHDFSAFELWYVSTHSRPKAAGRTAYKITKTNKSFNTQPPEGGWGIWVIRIISIPVSTHSRPKAAGSFSQISGINSRFQHTAARRRLGCLLQLP